MDASEGGLGESDAFGSGRTLLTTSGRGILIKWGMSK